MVCDVPTYNGYKLNCHKKKRKVENMIELHDKDSLNNAWDIDICKEKLEEISVAALAAVEYISDLILELEGNEEDERIQELTVIKRAVTDAVKKNDKEVRAEMQRILDSATGPSVPNQEHQVLTLGALQQTLSGLQINGAVLPLPQDQGHPPLQGQISKLTLRYGRILEDINDFQTFLSVVKLPSDMSDPEVAYFMREIKNWYKKMDDMISSNRKFKEETLGSPDLEQMADTLNDKIKVLKTVKDNKCAAIAQVDKS